MKFRICLLLLAAVIFLSCGFAPAADLQPENGDAIAAPSATAEELLLARVENLLAHNFVYNDDFDYTAVMVENSMLALIESCDEDGYLDRDLVEGFVYNMYGFDLADYEPSIAFPEKEGSVFVIPRGADIYSHEVLSVEVDGEYLSVESSLTLENHDGGASEFSCHTLFKENPNSAFGYNILSSVYY